MSIPLLPGYRRDVVGRGHFAKSHHFDVLQGTPLDVKRDVKMDSRAFIPPTAFNGTGNLVAAGASIVKGAAAVSANSAASNFSNTGRLPAPVEQPFASPARREAEDRYAHLRRPPVAKDFANTAEPTPHIQILDSCLPAYVEYANQVLRFSGYFKEAVHASAHETWRVRPILLYFYLEDDTIHIAEPAVTNAGIPQGVFVKRHRIPKDESQAIFQVEDLYVGAELPIYGRVFRLTDADAFTRAFYEKNGSPLADGEGTPQDPFSSKNSAPHSRTFHKLANPMTIHQEAALGKHFHNGIAQTQQFLKHDGKVLRFYATWDDTKLYGEKRPYIIHIFKADDTIEVLEVTQPNSGRDAFPCLLKRSKLPVDHTLVVRDVAHVGGNAVNLEDPQLQFVNETHFRIGGTINVYGRELLVCGCDAFTKHYYQSTYGLPDSAFDPISMKDPEDPPVRIEVPPSTGFGTEEDSLGSFLYLVPKAPKIDQKKLHEMDGILLRFSAQLLNAPYVDRDRKFVLTYYLANDTLQVFELFERNTGHIGGKWLDRQRTVNKARPGGNEYFAPRDFYIGAKITINGHDFIILDADKFTENFQDNNPAIWNQREGNLNRPEIALKHTRGKKIDWKASQACNTLPDRRPF